MDLTTGPSFISTENPRLSVNYEGAAHWSGKNHLHQHQPREDQLMSVTKNLRHSFEQNSYGVRQTRKSNVLCYDFHDG
jgi:hypothetical protein